MAFMAGAGRFIKAELNTQLRFVRLGAVLRDYLTACMKWADPDGNLDYDMEAFSRLVMFDIDPTPVEQLYELGQRLIEAGIFVPYTVRGHRYVAIPEMRVQYSPLYQELQRGKNAVKWRNPTPENPDGVSIPKSMQIKEISTDEVPTGVRSGIGQPVHRTEEDAERSEERRAVPGRTGGSGNQATIQRDGNQHHTRTGPTPAQKPHEPTEHLNPYTDTKKTLKRPQNRSQRVVGAPRAGTMAPMLEARTKKRIERDARLAADNPPPKKALRRKAVAAEQFDPEEYVGCSPPLIAQMVKSGELTADQGRQVGELRRVKKYTSRPMFNGYSD